MQIPQYKYTREELERAFAHYRAVKDECSRTGEWSPFAKLFTENCYYVEHAYGEFFGRAQVEQYITKVMAPFPTMRFVEDWIVYDDAHGTIIWQLQNVFPPPFDSEGKPFQFPNISRLVYAGGMQFSEEQDWYNPAGQVKGLHAQATTKAWRRAGGKFQSKEELKMMSAKMCEGRKNSPQEESVTQTSCTMLPASELYPLKRIASGSYGTIVLCEHLDLAAQRRELVALKLVDKNRLDTVQRIQRIDTELRVLRDVATPAPACFLVRGLGFFQTDNAVMFALEYCESGDLLSYFEKHPEAHVESHQTRLMLMQIAAGIAHLHSFGVVWRDAKMENILVDAQGKLKLCDFGLAKFLTPKATSASLTPHPLSSAALSPRRISSHTSLRSFFTKSGSTSSLHSVTMAEDAELWETTQTRYCGTSYYLSPQSVSGKPYGLEHDWWSFGVLAYEMLCGYLPFFAGEDNCKGTYSRIKRNRPKMRQFTNKTTKQFISHLLTTTRTKRLGFGPLGYQQIQAHEFFAKEVAAPGGWAAALLRAPIRLERETSKVDEFFDTSRCEFDAFAGAGRPDLVLPGFQVVDETTFQRLRALS